MDFFDRLLDVISDFAKEVRDRFGAWIVDSLGRLLKRVVKATAKFLYITISMLCPYFAWASVGEYLIQHGGWFFGALGALIVMLFPCFVLALIVIKWIYGPSITKEPRALETRDPNAEPVVADEIRPWYSRLGDTLLNIFSSEGRNTAAYYGIFVAGAVLITGMMLFSNAGRELANTNFGGINATVLSVIARGPVLIATMAYSAYAGISLSWDMTVFESILGLPHGTGPLGYISAIAFIAITIALAGWFLYRFSEPPTALRPAQVESSVSGGGYRSNEPPVTQAPAQQSQDSVLPAIVLGVVLVLLSLFAADWFFKFGVVPWPR